MKLICSKANLLKGVSIEGSTYTYYNGNSRVYTN